MNPIARFFSVQNMIRPEIIKGPLPETRETYTELSRIAFPSVVEMVFMSLIGSADVIMVSVIGYEAIAAVGLAGQPLMLMLSLFFALNVGVTAIVARRKGQERPEEASQTLRNALMLILGLTFVVMFVALTWSRELLLFAGAEADTIDMAESYFRILASFLPINAMTMCINAAQRGIGNTRITMYTNVTANVVNVCCNFLLIYGNWGFPEMGVAGAALASGIGYCAAFVMCLYAIMVNNEESFLRLSFKDSWKPHKETLLSILRVGGNAMIEQAAMRIGFFSYAKIVAGLGTASFAAHQVAMQFLSLSFTFGDGLAVAATSMVGQMLGRERPDIAEIYGKCGQRMAVVVSVVLASLIAIFRYPLVSIFLDPTVADNALPYSIAVNLMLMVAVFQPIQMSSVVISGCLRGAGDNLYVALIMIICVVGIRPLLSLFAIHTLDLGLIGAWSASLVDMSVRLTLMYRRFNSGKWHEKKV